MGRQKRSWSRYAELVDGGRLDPPVRAFGGDDAPRQRRTAAIAEQGKASRSRSRHARRDGLRDLRQSLEHDGDRRRDADRRRFQVVSARARENPGWQPYTLSQPIERLAEIRVRTTREPERSENLRRRRLDLGVDENGEHLRQRDRWTELVADARHHSGLRTKAGENVRSRRRRRGAQRVDRRPTIAPRRRATRRAAAASADPPPSPAAAGKRLTNRKRPSFNPGDLRRERARGAQHQILFDRASLERPRTEDLKNQIARRAQTQASRTARQMPRGFRVHDSRRRGAQSRARSD